VQNKANSGAGPWDCGLPIADCGLKRRKPTMTNRHGHAKQSQFSEGRHEAGGRRLEETSSNKAKLGRDGASGALGTSPAGRFRRFASGVCRLVANGTTGVKKAFTASAVLAGSGREGESHPPAGSPQGDKRNGFGAGRVDDLWNKANSGGKDRPEVLYGKRVTSDSASVQGKANLPGAGRKRHTRGNCEAKPIRKAGAGMTGRELHWRRGVGRIWRLQLGSESVSIQGLSRHVNMAMPHPV
jgi:hypothetical protein